MVDKCPKWVKVVDQGREKNQKKGWSTARSGNGEVPGAQTTPRVREVSEIGHWPKKIGSGVRPGGAGSKPAAGQRLQKRSSEKTRGMSIRAGGGSRMKGTLIGCFQEERGQYPTREKKSEGHKSDKKKGLASSSVGAER